IVGRGRRVSRANSTTEGSFRLFIATSSESPRSSERTHSPRVWLARRAIGSSPLGDCPLCGRRVKIPGERHRTALAFEEKLGRERDDGGSGKFTGSAAAARAAKHEPHRPLRARSAENGRFLHARARFYRNRSRQS